MKAAYVSLIEAFGKALDLSAALGVWEELRSDRASGGARPSRKAYQAVIDASIQHPAGLRHAVEGMARMKTDGYSFLGTTHQNMLILGFGQARNLEAALSVFREATQERIAAAASLDTSTTPSAVYDGGRSPGLSDNPDAPPVVVVDEDTLAALLEACRRSGDAASSEEALRLLERYGVRPPRQLFAYLRPGEKGVNAKKSALYEKIFGDDERSAKGGGVEEFVANKVVASNLRRVQGSVIGDAYRAVGAGVGTFNPYDDARRDDSGKSEGNFYSRKPRRSDGSRGDDDIYKEIPKAEAETTRVWTFDGRAASMKIRELSATERPLKLEESTLRGKSKPRGGSEKPRSGGKKINAKGGQTQTQPPPAASKTKRAPRSKNLKDHRKAPNAGGRAKKS
jgi:pentatricopeptide repeat protein